MGTIAEKLAYTYNAVEHIEDALRDKGCDLDDIPLKEYWRYILALKTTDLFFEELSAIRLTYYKIEVKSVDDIMVNEDDYDELNSKTVLNTEITQLNKPIPKIAYINDNGNVIFDNEEEDPNDKFIIGETYHFAGYDWICAEKIYGGYIIQSCGVTNGQWPGYVIDEILGSRDITGIDISTYNDKDDRIPTLYNTIKNVEIKSTYGQGLYLVGTDKVGTESYDAITDQHKPFREAMVIAANNYVTFPNSSNDCTWIANTARPGSAFYILARGSVYSGSGGAGWIMVVAPAFNIDKSKVTIDDDNNIIIIGE